MMVEPRVQMAPGWVSRTEEMRSSWRARAFRKPGGRGEGMGMGATSTEARSWPQVGWAEGLAFGDEGREAVGLTLCLFQSALWHTLVQSSCFSPNNWKTTKRRGLTGNSTARLDQRWIGKGRTERIWKIRTLG